MTENWTEKTIATYDASAEQLAAYFQGIGSRVDDIERAIALADDGLPLRVVELGCGDGRDAAAIIQRVGWYEGVDASRGLLDIALQKLPDTRFVHETAQAHTFPEDLDIVFAFASLLHLSKEENRGVFERAAEAIRPAGIFYVSLKESETYETRLQQDQYGERMFYYYDVATVEAAARPYFSTVYEDHQARGSTNWLTLALRRN